jgi:DNA polymerase-3 subunit alpha
MPHHEIPVLVRKRAARGNAKPQRFVSLHHHSTLSYLDGYGLPAAHVRRMTELNMGALAMTEHGNIDSHTQLERAAVKASIKPIFGCEIYMPAEPTLSKNTQMKFHLTVIARNAEGYRNLVRLVTASNVPQNKHGPYYFEATVTWEMLCAHKAGLTILSGCLGSYLACATVGGKSIPDDKASLRRGIRVAKRFAAEFGKWYVVECQAFPELDKTRQFNALAGQIARAAGTRLVASMDCHYTEFTDAEMQNVLHGLRPGQQQSMEERARTWGYDVPLCPPPNDMSIYRRLRQTGLSKAEAIEAIVTTEELAQECEVELPKMEMVRFPLPDGYTSSIDYWRDQLLEGWKLRKLNTLPRARRAQYRKQLVHEMSMIEEKDFVDYFLLTQAGVVHVKDAGHPVGPARGSAGASVCAWLLRITEVDPLRPDFNGLLRFERFIDITRTDLPDIDLDFPGSVRTVLRDFYLRLLGPGCVNNVGTFTYFRSKNSLDDVARQANVPKAEVELVKSHLTDSDESGSTIANTIASSDEAAKVFSDNPALLSAAKLEGNIRGFGIHAAGLILSNGPLTEVTSTTEREVPKGSGRFIQAIGFDKRDAKYRGMLKMDFLGLNTMQMLDDCINHPDVPLKLDDLYAMPLNDKVVYDAFCHGDCTGIFQFDGGTTRNVCNGVQPTVFQELMDITSLSRPGPLHGGSTAEYIDIKNGKQMTELHPVFTKLTALTRGQIIYQEQIMDVLSHVGGFDTTQVNAIRTIVSEKAGSAEFDKYHDDFIKGAAKIGMTFDVADLIWRRMVTAGSYSFNVAHAAAYSQISYYTQWFKQHYPPVFVYAALKNLGGSDKKGKAKVKEIIRDGKEFGRDIDVLPPSLRHSGDTWQAHEGNVLAGFSQIPNIGEKTTEAIRDAKHQARGAGSPWTTWDDLITVKGIGKKTVEKIKAFVIDDDPFDAYKVDRQIELVIEAIRAGELGPLPMPTHEGSDMHENEGVEYPVVWCGVVNEVSLRDYFEYSRTKFGKTLDPATERDPELREFAVCFSEDGTESVIVKIDRWRFPKFKRAIETMNTDEDVILVQGKRSKYAASRQINVNNMWVIEP